MTAMTITQMAIKGEIKHIKTSQTKTFVDMFVDIHHRNTTCTLPSKKIALQTNTRNWDKFLDLVVLNNTIVCHKMGSNM